MGNLFSGGNSDEDDQKQLIQLNSIGNKKNKKNKSKGIFSIFSSSESSKNNGNNGTTNLDIFEKINNIYFQRHAVSCANTIEKVFEKGQMEKTKHAANSGISYVGVQQCLQVCDYFGNFRIDTPQTKEGKKPLLIFCCSELTRTHQTLFLSWLKYLKDYKAKPNNGKIIVLPWLNEVSLPSKFGIAINKDNFPASIENTRIAWSNFIQNLKTNIERIKADTLNKENQDFKLIPDIDGIGECEEWDKLFYLSPIIFKKDGDPFSNSGKKTPIKRIFDGHGKRVGDMNQFIGLFNKILAEYINVHRIKLDDDYNGIQLVLVAHHNSAEHLIKFLMPSTKEKFNEQQLVNCEVVKLPGSCLKKPGEASSNLEMERIFPLKQKLDIQINTEELNQNEKTLSRRLRKIYVNPLFILYMSELNLFLSVNNIVKTRLKAKFDEMGSRKEYISDKRIQVEKPLFRFLLALTLEEYLKELENAKRYIEKLNQKYEGKPTYYKYNAMIQEIDKKIGFLSTYFTSKGSKKQEQQYQKEKSVQEYIENKTKNGKNVTKTKEEITEILKGYLFEFCGLKQPDIDSIAVF